jgi:diguanylate cyclase
MAWFRGRQPDDEAPAETLARLLRVFGEHGFDTAHSTAAEVMSRAESWAGHVLHGGRVDGEETEGARDWRRLRHFFEARRQSEKQHVANRERRFRDAFSATIHALRSLIRADQVQAERVERLLAEVEAAAQSGSLDAVRTLVPQAVGALRDEVSSRNRRLEGEVQHLVARLEATESALNETRQAAETDPLTQLFNRGALDEALARARASARPGGDLTLMLVDLDHFKRVNDEHGHPAGDAVLKAFADCLVRTFPRRSDLVARYGGEEFAALLPGVDADSARRLADRLLTNTRALQIAAGGAILEVRCSVGHARLQPDESATAWVDRVDRALYRAKHGGRDRAVAAD